MKITSRHICDALQRQHKKHLWCEELRISSGFGHQGRIDFWAMDPAPSSGNKAISYEVKVSRSDFKRDTYDKQRGARLISDEFYYVTPKGMLRTDEIPDWAGLIEFDWKKVGSAMWLVPKTTIRAPKRDKDMPAWGLVCSLIRNANKYGGSL